MTPCCMCGLKTSRDDGLCSPCRMGSVASERVPRPETARDMIPEHEAEGYMHALIGRIASGHCYTEKGAIDAARDMLARLPPCCGQRRPTATAYGDIASGRRQEVIEQLCKMMSRAWRTIDPSGSEASDCVCRANAFNAGDKYRNAGHALTFMEEAVSAHIAKYEREQRGERATPDEGAKALSEALDLLEELASSDCDMPSHHDTMDRVDVFLAKHGRTA